MTRQNAPSFDRIARSYRWLEHLSFGRSLEHCRLHFLPELSTYRRALELGDGDGRFTAELLATHRKITVEAIDSSAGMLRLLTARVSALGAQACGRLETQQSDALGFQLAGAPYDLAVTHFFLDCLSEAEAATLVRRLEPHLTSQAAWLISEFAIPGRQPMHFFSRTIIAGLYRAFGLLTGLKTRSLPDYAPLLRRAGFRLHRQRSHLGGLLVSELWLRQTETPKATA